MPRLTDDLARSAVPAPGKSETVIYDDAIQGFALRVRSSGAKTGIWRRRRPDGRLERYTIGSWPSTRAAAAREVAKQRDAEWTAEAHGVPVERIDRTKHRQARREPTLGELADEWLEAFERMVSEGRRRETTLEEYRRHLTRDIASLRRRPEKALTRQDVTTVLVALEAEHGRSAAVGARATLSSLCSWALERARLDFNPVVGSYKPDGAGDRERVLTDNELREVWQAAEEYGGDFGSLVKLLALTGQRRKEIGGLRWSEVD